MKNTKLVKDFNKVFDFPIRTIDEIEPLESRQLRIKLLFEELQELAQAGDVSETFYNLCLFHTAKIDDFIYSTGDEHFIIKDGNNINKIEELDAITDIDYLLCGKKLSSGLHEVSDKAFELVHENNMNKAHKDYSHIGETLNGHININEYTIFPIIGGGLVLYNPDGKLTKPHDHKKVDLKQLFK
jgi:predicted HAD superfamily Cof-like phosphohydrolase